MENYFLISCETYMLTVPGKFPSVSLNSLLKTWDGSILLVVWPGFLWINFLFREGYLKDAKVTLRLLCDRLDWGRGGVRRGLLSTQGDAGCPVMKHTVPCAPGCRLQGPTVRRTPESGQGHSQGPSAWYLVEWHCPSPMPNTNVHLLFACLAVKHTCLSLCGRNDFSWPVHSVAGVRINTGQTRQHSFSTAPGFSTVKLVMSPSAIGKEGGFP